MGIFISIKCMQFTYKTRNLNSEVLQPLKKSFGDLTASRYGETKEVEFGKTKAPRTGDTLFLLINS